jgi:Mn2+/Fe2+ NRAMP family transporter
MSRLRIAAFLAVLGPGVLAGLSDDDPAGITTYSILGADHGYELVWVLVVATAMLILYHTIAVRLGAVTGQGLAGLIRERFGVRTAFAMTTILVVANLGTTAAEFAGIASALGLAGIPRGVSVPAAAIGVSWLVIGSQFRRIEHVLLLLAATLSAYVLAGSLAGPDWYGTYLGTMAIAAVIVLIPSVPLVPVLYLSQALNAILLVPLLFVLNRLASDGRLMGAHVSGPVVRALSWAATAILLACVLALGVVSVI